MAPVKRELNRASAVATVTLAVGLAGCGGGGPSREQFVANANRACAEVSAGALPKSKTIEDVARNGSLVVAADKRELAKLRKVAVPDKDRPKFDEFVRLVEQETVLAEREASAAKRNDKPLLLAVDPLLSAKASEAATAAKQLGLRSCAEQ